MLCRCRICAKDLLSETVDPPPTTTCPLHGYRGRIRTVPLVYSLRHECIDRLPRWFPEPARLSRARVCILAGYDEVLQPVLWPDHQRVQRPVPEEANEHAEHA